MYRILVAQLAALLLAAGLGAQNVRVLNSAGFVDGPVAPGSLASAFGDFGVLSPGQASSLPLPTELEGARVLVDGQPAPIVATAPGQINFQVPFTTPAGMFTQSVDLTVEANGASIEGMLAVREVSPGIFLLDSQDPNRPAAVVNEDGAVNAEGNPAPPGSVVQLFATGQGSLLEQEVPSGAAPGAAVETSETPAVFVSTTPAEVLFSGLPVGYPGLWQVSFRIPEVDDLAGRNPILLVFDGAASRGASIWVR